MASTCKRRLLSKAEARFIVKRLRTCDVEVMEAFVTKYVDEHELHVGLYPSRKMLWALIRSNGQLPAFLCYLRSQFCNLMEAHLSGRERFARFLVAWYQFSGTVACSKLEGDTAKQEWLKVTDSLGDKVITDEDRSALVSGLATAVYSFMQKQVCMLQSSWRTTQVQVVETKIVTDDDASLYRLFGFSLFVSIKFRKKAVFGRLNRKFTGITRTKFARELCVLQSLKETDKSVLPAIIAFQDRGKMVFPHQKLLPFCRHSSRKIKQHMNQKQFCHQGRRIIANVKQQVLRDEDLLQEFRVMVTYLHRNHVEDPILDRLCRELLQRVINTMANSFFESQSLLDRVASNKGVDAQLSLRDKLKAFASTSTTKLL